MENDHVQIVSKLIDIFITFAIGWKSSSWWNSNFYLFYHSQKLFFLLCLKLKWKWIKTLRNKVCWNQGNGEDDAHGFRYKSICGIVNRISIDGGRLIC